MRNEDFAAEQKKDPDVKEIIDFMEREDLPMDDQRASSSNCSAKVCVRYGERDTVLP